MKAAKLTQTQQKAIDEAMTMYEEAQASFEDWFMHSRWTGGYHEHYESFEEAVEDNYRWLARRDSRNDQEGYIAKQLAFCRRHYEEHRAGIVTMRMSSNTLRAIAKKGYIEIIEDNYRQSDKFRLLCI